MYHRHLEYATQVLVSPEKSQWETIWIPIAIAVIGWLVALVLQHFNLRNQLKNQIKYDIYKQIIQVHPLMQDKLNDLMTISSTPFIMMNASLIGVDFGLKTREQGLQDGLAEWNKHRTKGFEDYMGFIDHYLVFLYTVEDWAAPIKNILYAKEELTRYIHEQENQISGILSELQSVPVDQGSDWSTWNQGELLNRMGVINQLAQDIQLFIHDFVVLVHNELMSEYFGYKRPLRRPQNPDLLVLTEKGFVRGDQIS